MKRIVAVVGSPKTETSTTAALVKRFVGLVRETDPDVELDVVSLGGVRVAPCEGCWTCSATGLCRIKDDLAAVHERISRGDLVILASPVFAANVSAQMKAFIDRSLVWSHTMRLFGKPSMTAVTAAFSDMTGPENYLRSMLIALGSLPMGALRDSPFAPADDATFRARWSETATRVVETLNGRARPDPTAEHVRTFEMLRTLVRGIPGGYAKRVWEANGWMERSFEEALAATV